MLTYTFHFTMIRFPYQNLNYFDAMDHLVGLKAEGRIKNIGLTNFDTTHMQGLMDRGAPIVSNQVNILYKQHFVKLSKGLEMIDVIEDFKKKKKVLKYFRNIFITPQEYETFLLNLQIFINFALLSHKVLLNTVLFFRSLIQ
jgi:predicted oxidoreductase